MTEQEAALGRQVSELLGAIGIYLGAMDSGEGDEDRLKRALKRALRSEAFILYMAESDG